MDLGPPPYVSTPTTHEDHTPRKFPYLTFVISLLLTILSLSTALLWPQNIQLRKQIITLTNKQLLPTPPSIPSPTPQTSSKICGGIAGIKCPKGEVCQTTAMYPDASGTCTKDDRYTCPENGYVDCMPGPNAGVRHECTSEAMSWYKANCSNFQGGAL
jgi:hypothetical protein